MVLILAHLVSYVMFNCWQLGGRSYVSRFSNTLEGTDIYLME